MFLLDSEFLALAVYNQGIRNISKRLLHSPLIDERRLLCLGLSELDLVSYSSAFKNRLERASTDAPEPCSQRKIDSLNVAKDSIANHWALTSLK